MQNRATEIVMLKKKMQGVSPTLQVEKKNLGHKGSRIEQRGPRESLIRAKSTYEDIRNCM